jgi:hypothetical protein
MYKRITDYIAGAYKMTKVVKMILAIAKSLRDLIF